VKSNKKVSSYEELEALVIDGAEINPDLYLLLDTAKAISVIRKGIERYANANKMTPTGQIICALMLEAYDSLQKTADAGMIGASLGMMNTTVPKNVPLDPDVWGEFIDDEEDK